MGEYQKGFEIASGNYPQEEGKPGDPKRVQRNCWQGLPIGWSAIPPRFGNCDA